MSTIAPVDLIKQSDWYPTTALSVFAWSVVKLRVEDHQSTVWSVASSVYDPVADAVSITMRDEFGSEVTLVTTSDEPVLVYVPRLHTLGSVA